MSASSTEGKSASDTDACQVRVYITSVSTSAEVKQNQQRALFVLESKKIPFETVDITQSKAKARMMRVAAEDPSAPTPQFFKGEVYLGGYNKFVEAVDDEILEVWLRLVTEMPEKKKEDPLQDELHLRTQRQLKRLERAMKGN